MGPKIKIKRSFPALLTTVLLLLVSSFSIQAHASSVHVISVAAVTQAKSKWCWAATAQMIGSVIYPSGYQLQGGIVAYIKGSSDVNELATPSEFQSAISYADGYLKSYTYQASTMSWSQLDYQITRGYPVAANTSQHVVLITGTISTDPSNYYVVFNEPLYGQSYTVTYDSFLHGYYTVNIFGEIWYRPYLETYYAS